MTSLPVDDEGGYVLTPAASEDRLITAVNRLAQALEHNTLAILDQRVAAPPVQARPALAPLPPVAAAPFDGCPIHQVPWKVVPAGISKKSGKAYESFRACSVAGCDQRPPR